jgi:hypothetical protein
LDRHVIGVARTNPDNEDFLHDCKLLSQSIPTVRSGERDRHWQHVN